MGGRVTKLRLAADQALQGPGDALSQAAVGPAGRKRMLLEGLCELLKADAGMCVVTRARAGAAAEADRDETSVISIARWAVSDDDARVLAAGQRGQPLPRGPAPARAKRPAIRRRGARRHAQIADRYHT